MNLWIGSIISFVGMGLASYLLLDWVFARQIGVRKRLVALEAPGRPGEGRGAIGAVGHVPDRARYLDTPFFARVVAPALEVLSRAGERLTPSGQLTVFKGQLTAAGLYGDRWLRGILALRAGGVVVGVAAVVLLVPVKPGLGILAGGAIALVTQVLPTRWLRKRIAGRKEAIGRSLPDVLDLVTASVEAGLSFDASVVRLAGPGKAGKAGRELKEELGRYLADMRLGRSRPDALWDLARRCDVPDLRSVVAALLQADELGVGVANVLRAQGQGLRTRRRHKAQEAALQAPVKMLFPLVFFIFPALFIVTLGPAALKIMDTFAHMNH